MAGSPDHPDDHGESPAFTDEALQDINRWWTVSRIVSNTSHDLNNALQIISGNVEMLRSKEPLDPAIERRTSSIAAQATRAAAAVGRLLAYARETTSAVAQRVDLHALATAAIALRGVTLSRARIAVSLTRDDDQPYWVAIDPQEGLQLLLNLMLEAERSLRGQPAAEIGVHLSRGVGSIALTVEQRADPWKPAAEEVLPLAYLVAQTTALRLASRGGGRLVTEPVSGTSRRAMLTLPSID